MFALQRGRLNTQADALSRLQTDGETVVDIDTEIPCFILEQDVDEDSLDFLDIAYANEDAVLTAELSSRKEELLTPITRE